MNQNHDFPAPATAEIESSKELKTMPVERRTVGISENPYGGPPPAWQKGEKQYNVANGIVQFNDGDDPRFSDVALDDGRLISELKEQGYALNPEGRVLVGDGEHPNEAEHIMPDLALNKAARESGAQRREATFVDQNGTEQTYVTPNPFEYGDFVAINSASPEIAQDGTKVWHPSLLRQELEDPAFLAGVGRFNINNGVLALTTVAGERQITTVSAERVKRLQDMGYTQNENMFVPHSNGEQWNTDIHLMEQMNYATGKHMGTVPEIWERIRSGESTTA